jgi:hypothetical protein
VSGINLGRWLGGGVAAGLLLWLLEGMASMLYLEPMRVAMEAHGLAMEMSAGMFVLSVIVSLLCGLTLTFFYAAARPRFGAGPRTAVLVAVALWLGGYVLSLLGYHMLGLFPVSMLVLWGAVGLAEMILAALLGGWIYREGSAAST